MATTKEAAPSGKSPHSAFYEFVDEFKNESDRAAVILGAAQLDLHLYELLSLVLRPCTSRSDDLLDGDGPLGTFSSRITLAHRLGLIDDEFCRALNLIRRIRNAFAHELTGTSLDSGAHRDRVRELTAPFRSSDAFEYILGQFFEEDPGPGAGFRAVVALASIRLSGACQEPREFPWTPWTLVPSDYKHPSKRDPDEADEDDAASVGEDS